MRHLKLLLSKYNTMKPPVKAALWFTLCGIIQKGISMLSTPIFTRILSTEQYGVFSVYNSWYGILSILGTMHLYYSSYNNAMTKYPEDRPIITSSMQGLTTALTILLFGIYCINPSFWNGVLHLSSLYMYVMFAELLFLPAYNFWAAKERYDYKYKKLIITTVIIALGSPLLGVIAVLSTTYKAEARVLSYAFVQICVGLIFYLYNLYNGKRFFSKKYWKYGLMLGLPLIPHYLSSTILNHADRIMINNMVGTGEAAVYSVAYSIASMMTIITTAIKNTYTPHLYKSLKAKQYDSLRTVSNMLVLLVAGLTCIAMLLGPEIISIFSPKSYHDAIWVIPSVACAVFFQFLYPMFSTVEFYYEKTGFILIASCSAALTNIVLNQIFIKIFGYYAAGYTTLFSYVVYSLGHYLFQKKVFQKYACRGTEVFNSSFILMISVLLICVMIGITFLYSYLIPRYILIVTICIIGWIKRKKIIQFYLTLKHER